MAKRASLLIVVLLMTLPLVAKGAGAQEEGAVPAYNKTSPAKGEKLPDILPKENLWGDNAQFEYQTHAYELAKIPKVIYQQPCYCYCDRMGHKSLHTCFEGMHGAQCSTCLKELYYSYDQTKKGKTAAQIRQGIMKGEWKQVNLEASATMN